MKKIIGVITIIVIILVAITIKRNDIYKVYKTNQIANDTINCINGKFSKRIHNSTIKDYERLHTSNEELNHNNITELVNVYIDSVINGMDIYIKNNKTVIRDGGEYIEINRFIDVEKGKDIWMKYLTVDYAVGESFTNEDVRNYSNGKLKDLLINNLKECLDYEEQDDKIEWYINSTEDKRIVLPYDCYIDYEAYNFELNHNFKRAISVDVSNFNFDIGGGIKEITYETVDGKNETKSVDIYRQEDGKYYVSLSSVLGTINNSKAECTLSSYTLDRWREEMETKFFRENPIVD